MEMNEAFRRIVVGHRRLLLIFALAPLLAVALITVSFHPGYAASARIQQSSVKVGSDTEADSVVNQVRGIATSTTAINQALTAAGVNDRRASDVAGEVTVTQFGASPVLDITVTDSRPEVATRVATTLARRWHAPLLFTTEVVDDGACRPRSARCRDSSGSSTRSARTWSTGCPRQRTGHRSPPCRPG
jgi:capsular polysaccharide biosynthesis protein